MMKFTFAVASLACFTTVLADMGEAPGTIFANPLTDVVQDGRVFLDQCHENAACTKFTYEKVCPGDAGDNVCTDEGSPVCAWRVCLSLDFTKPNCPLDAHDAAALCEDNTAWSNTCEIKNDVCVQNGFNGLAGTSNIEPVNHDEADCDPFLGDTYFHCITVEAGGTGMFTFKKANERECLVFPEGGQSYSEEEEPGFGISCGNLEGPFTTSATKGGKTTTYIDGCSQSGGQCLWTMTVPEIAEYVYLNKLKRMMLQSIPFWSETLTGFFLPCYSCDCSATTTTTLATFPEIVGSTTTTTATTITETTTTGPTTTGTTKAGGGGGDSHFKRWNMAHTSFHGECDLVMVSSSQFHNSAGLDLHVRTTIEDYFSYIEEAVLRVGNDVLEVHRKELYLNGALIKPNALPITFGDNYKYTVSKAAVPSK
jgi:hypothetical protein